MQFSLHVSQKKQELQCLEIHALHYPLKIKEERSIRMYLICSISLITVDEGPAEGQNTDAPFILPCRNQDKVLPLLKDCNKAHFSFVFLNSKQEAIRQYLKHGFSHEARKGKGCRNCLREVKEWRRQQGAANERVL